MDSEILRASEEDTARAHVSEEGTKGNRTKPTQTLCCGRPRSPRETRAQSRLCGPGSRIWGRHCRAGHSEGTVPCSSSTQRFLPGRKRDVQFVESVLKDVQFFVKF